MKKFMITCFMAMSVLTANVYADDAGIFNSVDSALESREDYVKTEEMTAEEFVTQMTEYYATNLNADFISNDMKIYDENKNGLYDAFGPDYTHTAEEESNIRAYIVKAENGIIEQTAPLSNRNKVKYIYTYFCKNFTYDSELNYEVYHLYKEKCGTCRSFTLAFKLIMDRLNIPCKIVLSDDMSHEWNKVFIDNEWQNVDITEGIRLYGTGYPNAYMRAYLTR